MAPERQSLIRQGGEAYLSLYTTKYYVKNCKIYSQPLNNNQLDGFQRRDVFLISGLDKWLDMDTLGTVSIKLDLWDQILMVDWRSALRPRNGNARLLAH